MGEPDLGESDEAAINERMAAQIEKRRRARPERRLTARPHAIERRAICVYCFQRGDHPTAAHCLRALERVHGVTRVLRTPEGRSS